MCRGALGAAVLWLLVSTGIMLPAGTRYVPMTKDLFCDNEIATLDCSFVEGLTADTHVGFCNHASTEPARLRALNASMSEPPQQKPALVAAPSV